MSTAKCQNIAGSKKIFSEQLEKNTIPKQDKSYNVYLFYFYSFRTQQNQIDRQYLTFGYQTIASVVIYVPTLITIFIIINFDTTGFMEQWKCSPHIVFDNYQFILCIVKVISMGFISLVLSYSPNFLAGVESLVRKIGQISRYLLIIIKFLGIS